MADLPTEIRRDVAELAATLPRITLKAWGDISNRLLRAADRIEEIETTLQGIRQYGSDTLSGRVDGPDDREWQREAVMEMTRRARVTLESLPARGIDEAAPRFHCCAECRRSQPVTETTCEECGSRRFWLGWDGPVTDYAVPVRGVDHE